MIAIVLLLVSLLLVAATPWRRLPLDGRLWAAAALLNTMVFFALPTTPATSPWRPVVAHVLAGCAVASLLLVILGLILWRRHGTLASGGVLGWRRSSLVSCPVRSTRSSGSLGRSTRRGQAA
jgi:hypothetical protein